MATVQKQYVIEKIETIQHSEKQENITLCTNLLITQGGYSFYFGLKDTNMKIVSKLDACYFSQGGQISTLG